VALPVAAATLGLYVVYKLAKDYVIVPKVMGRTVQVPAVVFRLFPHEVVFGRLDTS
jgi:predicted PurR-regulated permease PerM